jgi:hypothetical protein
MKKIQAPNAHRAGVSHIYFAQVLAYFSTPRKCKNLRKKKSFLFAHPGHQGYRSVFWCQGSPNKNGEQLGCTLAVCPHYKREVGS